MLYEFISIVFVYYKKTTPGPCSINMLYSYANLFRIYIYFFKYFFFCHDSFMNLD